MLPDLTSSNPKHTITLIHIKLWTYSSNHLIFYSFPNTETSLLLGYRKVPVFYQRNTQYAQLLWIVSSSSCSNKNVAIPWGHCFSQRPYGSFFSSCFPQHVTDLRFFLNFYLLIDWFLAALGLRCCVRAFSSCGEQRLQFVAARGLLIAVASLVAEHGL